MPPYAHQDVLNSYHHFHPRTESIYGNGRESTTKLPMKFFGVIGICKNIKTNHLFGGGCFNICTNIWCRREDLNLHGLPRLLLRQVRLPISPPAHFFYYIFVYIIIALFCNLFKKDIYKQ